MAERGVTVDHATLNRWLQRYAGQVAEDARRRKRPTDRSWRMDETYLKVKSQWVYLYRAVDKFGKTLDFLLSQRRNKPAAIKFLARAMEVNGLPRKIVIDTRIPPCHQSFKRASPRRYSPERQLKGMRGSSASQSQKDLPG